MHLGHENVSVHIKKLGQDEQRRQDRSTLNLAKGAPMVLISESGLYKLIMRSDKESARPFQDWVTKEVLPSIRKTGAYALADHGRTECGTPGHTGKFINAKVRVSLISESGLYRLTMRCGLPASHTPGRPSRTRTGQPSRALDSRS